MFGFSLMARHIKYYKGEGGGFPSLGCGEFCESLFAHGLSMQQKCSDSALTNSLFGLCRSVWLIKLLVIRPSPIPEPQHAPLPSKCCEPGSVPNSFSFRCLYFWICSWVHQGAWGCVIYSPLLSFFKILICFQDWLSSKTLICEFCKTLSFIFHEIARYLLWQIINECHKVLSCSYWRCFGWSPNVGMN